MANQQGCLQAGGQLQMNHPGYICCLAAELHGKAHAARELEWKHTAGVEWSGWLRMPYSVTTNSAYDTADCLTYLQ